MRNLTPEECEFIAGGLVRSARHLDSEVPTVVVVASPPPYYPPPYYPPPAPPPYFPPPPPPGGGGGGGGGYTVPTDPNPSPAAVQFAAAHVKNLMPGDAHASQEQQYVTAVLELIYDKAQSNPNAYIQLGNGQSITAAQLLQDVSATSIEITNNISATGATGAQTNLGAGGIGSVANPVIGINPDNQNQLNYDALGTPGFDYTALHELGHAVETLSEGVAAGQSEPYANTTGNSIANFIGVPDLANPTNGFG